MMFYRVLLNLIYVAYHHVLIRLDDIVILYEILQVRDEVGASPAEIARAYMGNRASEISLGFKNTTSEDEITLLHGDESTAKPFIPSPSPKPPTCWPGSMAQDRHDYSTPQSQRSRFGLHNFPRTPYSRTIFSKSKTRVSKIEFLNFMSDSLRNSFVHMGLCAFFHLVLLFYTPSMSSGHSITG